MHILKKGYEMQKRSLIANIDLYMIEKDANKEFFPLLVVSCSYFTIRTRWRSGTIRFKLSSEFH